MATTLHKVFVYGTLKMGEPNHHWFSKAKDGFYKFLCKAKSIQKYPLVIATNYNIPFVLDQPDTGNYIHGEVYEVDDIVLEILDYLEDHPNFYIREEREVQSLEVEGEKITTWIYFIKKFKPELLELNMLENYSSKGEHGLEYMPSEESTLEDLNTFQIKPTLKK